MHDEYETPRVHVAVVGAADGVRLVAVGRTRRAPFRRLAAYVRVRVDVELPEDDARLVRRRLGAGDLEGAVRAYFACGARRWDEEWLHLTTAGGARELPRDRSRAYSPRGDAA
jgi:hypothetical protein